MRKNLVLLLLTVIVATCTPAEQGGTDSNALQKAIADLNEAFSRFDVEKLNDLTTDAYIHVNGSNAALSKQDWLKYLEGRKSKAEAGSLTITRYEFSEMKVERYGNTAFVTGRVDVEGIEDGNPFASAFRVSHCWVIQSRRWKRAGFQDARILE